MGSVSSNLTASAKNGDHMVKAKFQLFNENDPVDNPVVIEFETEEEMYAWWRKQSGHPYLSYGFVSKEIIL